MIYYVRNDYIALINWLIKVTKIILYYSSTEFWRDNVL